MIYNIYKEKNPKHFNKLKKESCWRSLWRAFPSFCLLNTSAQINSKCHLSSRSQNAQYCKVLLFPLISVYTVYYFSPKVWHGTLGSKILSLNLYSYHQR